MDKAAPTHGLIVDAEMMSAVTASLAQSGVSFALIRDDGRMLLDANSQLLFGIASEAQAPVVLRRIHGGDRKRALSWIRATFTNGNLPLELSMLDAQGRRRRVRLSAGTSTPTSTSVVVTITDISEQHLALETYREEIDHLRYTVELNPELPWIAEPDGKVIGFTDRWLAMTGLTREDALGDGWARVIHPDDLAHTAGATQNAVLTGDPFDVRFRATLADGDVRWMRARGFPRRDQDGRIVRWYGYTEDVHEIVLVEQSIQWTADHDLLTNLPNRALFNRCLEDGVTRKRLTYGELALLLIDVDNFKDVNDILGHDAGDTLLEEFGRSLLEGFPEGAIIARIGGDEFAVLLDLPEGPAEIDIACMALFERLQHKVLVSGRSLECRASIGAAIFPQHGANPAELFKNADIALYEAKNTGRGRMTLFRPEMKRSMQERVAMINLGRKCAADGSIIAYYQPQVSFEDGSLVGFEALLRRRDRRGAIHLPASLSAAFEDLDVAEALGVAMLERVVADMTRWGERSLAFKNVAINVSTAELRNTAFAERLVKRMDLACIPYGNLTIEVTEGVFLGRSAANAMGIIAELSRLGFPVALDDFGTGYASLSHLRQIPVDILKIDRSFISELGSSRDDRAIVSAIIHLGDSLGLKVVAEGIETTDQADLLRVMGCKYAQGFLCAYPTPAHVIPRLISSWDSKETFRSKIRTYKKQEKMAGGNVARLSAGSQ